MFDTFHKDTIKSFSTNDVEKDLNIVLSEDVKLKLCGHFRLKTFLF